MKNKALNVWMAMCCAMPVAMGQTTGFHYKANLPVVSRSGFYRIALSPNIAAHTATDFSDLRIIDDAGKWVPHLVQSTANPGSSNIRKSIAFEVKAADTESIVAFTTGKFRTGNIQLVVKNTKAVRHCSLSGSDDGKQWYTIADSLSLDPSEANDRNAVIQLRFPAVDYHMLRLVLPGKNPFNIVAVNTFVPAAGTQPVYVENPAPVCTNSDSAKTSYIRITQPEAYPVSRVECRLQGIAVLPPFGGTVPGGAFSKLQ